MEQHNRSPFLLITGCPRSGTSLLAAELTRRYDLAIPFETHFIPIFHRWQTLYGDLEESRNRRRMLDDIYLFTRMWLQSAKTFDQEKIARISILSTKHDAEQIVDESSDYASMCRAIYAAYGREHSATLTADKSTFMAAIPLETMSSALGNIKVVDLVRDGRDVFLSWNETWFGATSVSVAARLWAGHVNNAARWEKAHPEDCLTIRYEDLITSPDNTCDTIAQFTGLVPRTQNRPQNANTLSNAMASSHEHRLLMQDIDPDNMNKHVSGLSQKASQLFSTVAGPELTAHGYDVCGYRGKKGMSAFQIADWIQGLSGALFRRPGRMIKFSAPLLFFCGLRPVFRYWARHIASAPNSQK